MSPARLRRTDLACFYAAGSVVLHGGARRLYHVETLDPVLKRLQDSTKVEVNEYCIHPPFEVLLFALLALFPYRYAFVIWTGFNVGLLSVLAAVLMPVIPFLRRKPQAWLLSFCFLPTIATLALAQDSILVLAAIVTAYALLIRNRPVAAGLMLAMGAIKFQYVLPLILLLGAARKWRTVAGAALGGVCLGTISIAIFGSQELVHYYHFVEQFAPLQYRGFMVNAHGFFYGLGITSTAPAVLIEMAILGSGAVLAWLADPEELGGLPFAAYLLVALLSPPYLHLADMTLASLTLALVANYAIARKDKDGKILLVATAIFFIAPVGLLIAGGHYWWNSRIYLMFPITLGYLAVLSREILLNHRLGAVKETYACSSTA